MLTYGLTGGIGSGKSTVARYFDQLGFVTADADKLGHTMLEAGREVARLVLQRHPSCATSEGAVHRPKLAEIVFGDPAERRWLESLLHPAIMDELYQNLPQTNQGQKQVLIMEGAVLLESETVFNLAGMIVVQAPAPTRLARVGQRDGLSPQQIEQRMNSQMAEHEKLCWATHVIDNSGSQSKLREQVQGVAQQIAQETGGGI